VLLSEVKRAFVTLAIWVLLPSLSAKIAHQQVRGAREKPTMTTRKFLVVLAVFALIVAACGDDDGSEETTTAAPETTTAAPETTTAAPETTTAAPETTAAPTIGSADNPIQVLFVPSVSAEEIIAGGEILEQTLNETTGLTYEVSVPNSYAATVEAICAAPDVTIGFIPAQAYVLGNDLCGIEVGLKSKRFGYTEYWAQFIVARDSDITSLEDLEGLKWAYPDAGSTSGFLVPSALLTQLGVAPGESFETGGHGATARAVYLGEADVGTTFYSPYTSVEGVSVWDETNENADVPDPASCAVVAAGEEEGSFGEGDLVCGDVEVRDARRDIREEAPDVIQKVRILDLSDPIPNDTMSFGPEFPADVKTAIVDAMFAFAAEDPEGFATAFDAYSWDDVAETNDAEFDFIRALVQALGITVGDL
jgi:phosphonate transport system substrate-binding protein